MALTQRLDVRQTQAPVMTPQLQQAIKLLQLSNQELAAFVENELEQNPLLEREDALIEDAPSPGGEREAASEPADADVGDAATLTGRDSFSGEDTPLDANYSNVWQDDPFRGSTLPTDMRGSGGGGEPGLAIEQTTASVTTLRDLLTDQLNMAIADPIERLIGGAMIDQIDDSGFLKTPLDELAAQFGCDHALIERVLAVLKGFEPTGIFAAGLSECFALQLAERNRLDPAMQALLDNLELLARRDFEVLRRVCGVDREDLTEMIGELRALDPRPAAAYEGGSAEYVTPDVLMSAKPGGGWTIELNNETLPRVLVNRTYYTEIAAQANDREGKAFVHDCLQSANWLIRALDQRARTILKVATEIVRQQDGFFRHGVAHLKPLVLADIAEAVSMHESTISRVTANKYIATPRGIFELKYFFTTAISGTETGAVHSSESVRHRIRILIDGESPKSVLSDDRIVDILREDGIDIARRTVAKYRDSLSIPSSVERRRLKRENL